MLTLKHQTGKMLDTFGGKESPFQVRKQRSLRILVHPKLRIQLRERGGENRTQLHRVTF